MTSVEKDYIKLHVIVFLWGFTAILGLLISLPPVEMVFYRTLLAAVGLYILLKLWKKPLRVNKKAFLGIFFTGSLIAAHWILFFLSARVSTASVCLAGMATCSLWTAFFEPLVKRKSIKTFEVVLGLIVILGLYVIFSFDFDHSLGLILAILSAMLAAIFSVINGQLTHRHNPYVITMYEMAGACISIIIFFPFYTYFFSETGNLELIPTTMDWLYLGILALICTVYAYSVSVEIMKNLSAYAVNLTVNLEPVYGIILALLVFGEKEQMNPQFYLGTGIILLSVLLYPVLNKRHKRRALNTDNLR